MNNWLNETELKGELVTLLPFQKTYREELLQAASDGDLWNLWFTSVPSEKTIDQYIETALVEKTEGKSLPFIVVDQKTKKVLGSTRFCNVITAHRRLEIGYTWYAKSVQRTGVNTECKYLLLGHAFETLGCIAVEFRTNWHNQASRNAIARLGARQDGVLRNHQIDPNGILRDTVVFSITREEWPAVKKSLEFKMSNNQNR
ncbi:GNAT family N-acetyltransferase [Pedobacter nutrimenti]|uniref:RimJ/RimL family protein N-acetyltransferase n=1 Tax=Pedobacter nutrimenti TaxID=1241337 RepID=A0A318UHR2_9SPHI|nr:GNAT family protein [Pedobacter nutrimenti]PYF74877.1 RimJ/RimL family protein N-acetyltransferase [Pedobacter nutrimenti]